MIKKLFVGLCVFSLAFCGIVSLFSSNDTVAYAENIEPVYELNFNGVDGEAPAVTGTKQDADLTGGKSLVLQMDVKSMEITSSNPTVILRIASDAMIKAPWPSSYISFNTSKNYAGKWFCDGKLFNPDDLLTLNDLFKPGNTVKFVYKPYVDENNKGYFNIYTKSIESDSTAFVKKIGVDNFEKDHAPDKNIGMYLCIYGGMKLNVQNYSIKLSDGNCVDNSFTYSYKGIEDAGKYQFDTSMKISRITDNRRTYNVVFKPQPAYFGSQAGADIPLGQALVMEYDILQSNLESNNFFAGYIITTIGHYDDPEVASHNVESFCVTGNTMFDKKEFPHYTTGIYGNGKNDKGAILEGEFLPLNIFSAGKTVRAVYHPYISESQKGSFEIFTRPMLGTEFKLQFSAKGIGKDFAPKQCVRIYTTIQNYLQQDKNYIFEIGNYRIFTTDNENDAKLDIKGLGCNSNCTINPLTTLVSIKTSPTSQGESTWADIGRKIHVTADEVTDEKMIFDGWYFKDGKTLLEEKVSTEKEFDYVVKAEGELFVKHALKKVNISIKTSPNKNPEIVTKQLDEIFKVTADPVTEEGRLFDGWYFKDGKTDKEVKVSEEMEFNYTVSAEGELFVKYKFKKIKVSVVGGMVNGNESFVFIDWGSTSYILINNIPDGKVFSGWNIKCVDESSDNVYVAVKESDTRYKIENIKEDLIVEAVYQDCTFNVKLSNALCDGKTELTQKIGTQISVKANVPQKGYRFMHWIVNNERIEGEPSLDIIVDKDLTINAVYERIPLNVIVNGGSYSVDGENTYYGDTILLTPEIKEGYTFKGWYKGDTLVSDNENYSFELVEDTSLTAKYEKIKKSGCGSSVYDGEMTAMKGIALLILATFIVVLRKKSSCNK